MNPYETIMTYLHDAHIQYELIIHPPVASAQEYHDVLHTRFEQQAKALFVRYAKKDGEKGYYIIAIPGHKKADLEKIKKNIHVDSLRMAYENELIRITGCHFGELPPLGKPFGVKLLMDTDFLQEEKIYFNVGRHDQSVILSPQILQKIEDPLMLQM